MVCSTHTCDCPRQPLNCKLQINTHHTALATTLQWDIESVNPMRRVQFEIEDQTVRLSIPRYLLIWIVGLITDHTQARHEATNKWLWNDSNERISHLRLCNSHVPAFHTYPHPCLPLYHHHSSCLHIHSIRFKAVQGEAAIIAVGLVDPDQWNNHEQKYYDTAICYIMWSYPSGEDCM